MKTSYFFILPSLITLSLVYTPSFWVNLCVLVDFYTPWVLFESDYYMMYHNFLVSKLTEKPELPLPVLDINDVTVENVKKISKGFTFPFVIRGLLQNSTAIQDWKYPEWWLSNYSNETVLCGTLMEVVEDCTIQHFFTELERGKPFYISGASNIFIRNPNLHESIDTELIKSLEPGVHVASQIFMGVPDMGSDIHCAMGVNIFRQITGRKKWWFIPPSQTPYLIPSININSFSAHTKTLIGKEGATPSPWLNKLVRYTSILEPGDVLFNPPWFWHGILNLGDKEKNELIIGAPTRYAKGQTVPAAFKSNFVYSANAIGYLLLRFGPKSLHPDFRPNLQGDIANNRRVREHKEISLIDTHPLNEAD